MVSPGLTRRDPGHGSRQGPPARDPGSSAGKRALWWLAFIGNALLSVLLLSPQLNDGPASYVVGAGCTVCLVPFYAQLRGIELGSRRAWRRYWNVLGVLIVAYVAHALWVGPPPPYSGRGEFVAAIVVLLALFSPLIVAVERYVRLDDPASGSGDDPHPESCHTGRHASEGRKDPLTQSGIDP